MRDRTMVVLALLFLTLTIGAGVNKSLAACNRMVGKPMAPEIGEIYRRQVPFALSGVEKFARYGKNATSQITRSYPAVLRMVERSIAKAGSEIKSSISLWRQWLNNINSTKDGARFEKI
ncbi:MAG: hypothetical protein M1543_02065 [Firmicutes bacterium]|nr:hypothetical protein [Bacillota bacterium]